MAMTAVQNNELITACARLLSVSPEIAGEIVDGLGEDAEIAHFHLATLLNVLRPAE